MGSKIIGIGHYIPKEIIQDAHFQNHEFWDGKGRINSTNDVIASKLKQITGIEERRYVCSDKVSSDIGYLAAVKAIENAQIDVESIDYIIFAHNFGDIKFGEIQSDAVPSLASRLKHSLKIKNNACVAYDLIFGCPGWIEGVIQSHAFIKAGIAKTCLVIGAEPLSRVCEPHDRDSMIFADGAGAAIIQFVEGEEGIKSHASASHTFVEKDYLYFGKTNNQDSDSATKYIKMNGRKIYEFSLTHVPQAMKTCLDKSEYAIDDIKKIFIHQANEKMDEEIVKRFYQLYNKEVPENIMPMNIDKLGNSSVATVPTLYSMVLNNELPEHQLSKGDVILFASVGAGMNINAIVYKY